MLTPWADTLDRAQPLPEYPRPQMVRDSYLNLNPRRMCSGFSANDAPSGVR